MNLRFPLFAVVIVAFLEARLPARLQAQAPARPEFEVASLKPNASGNPGFAVRAMPAGITATNISLKRLIALGYSVTDYQIFGDLPWLETQRFDVEAKASKLTALPELRLMTQSLLDERFKLKFHRESRELSIYSLTLVKSGVKGPGLVDASTEPAPDRGDGPVRNRHYLRRSDPRGARPHEPIGRPALDDARPHGGG